MASARVLRGTTHVEVRPATDAQENRPGTVQPLREFLEGRRIPLGGRAWSSAECLVRAGDDVTVVGEVVSTEDGDGSGYRAGSRRLELGAPSERAIVVTTHESARQNGVRPAAALLPLMYHTGSSRVPEWSQTESGAAELRTSRAVPRWGRRVAIASVVTAVFTACLVLGLVLRQWVLSIPAGVVAASALVALLVTLASWRVRAEFVLTHAGVRWRNIEVGKLLRVEAVERRWDQIKTAYCERERAAGSDTRFTGRTLLVLLTTRGREVVAWTYGGDCNAIATLLRHHAAAPANESEGSVRKVRTPPSGASVDGRSERLDDTGGVHGEGVGVEGEPEGAVADVVEPEHEVRS